MRGSHGGVRYEYHSIVRKAYIVGVILNCEAQATQVKRPGLNDSGAIWTRQEYVIERPRHDLELAETDIKS